MTIREFLTKDHRVCDDIFSELENRVASKNFDHIEDFFARFKSAFLNHFKMEEDVLFPMFNSSCTSGCNPTGVMIAEHEQMKAAIAQMQSAVEAKNYNKFLGIAESFMFLVQQHNMKEEQIMYNLADGTLAGKIEMVIDEMKKVVA